ncbi:hypothetical protein EK0264_01160 [Epidermidibacterium keratini]|uniref:Prepilin type IV endopeptidase peptidase domain-containing protein n=1 Tax=Epidermidibacterium keratini TaxID=1891644 RepID=A0A7L4YHY0_9ACTN|nr:prepilin peptidase [Epidermidibacterium keratini]QHB99045.1 hypothetical protein EK0264_01160 [Epidermidibacterium keratini]
MIGALPGIDAIIAGYVVLLGGAIIVSDAREHRIPNRLTASWAVGVMVIAAVAAPQFGWGDLWRSLATGGAMFAAGYLLAILGPDAFGFGDVKLLGCVGLAIGHLEPQLVVVWLLALAVWTLVWLLLAPWLDRRYDRRTPLRRRQIAFAPPIVLALWSTYGVVLLSGGAAG